MWGLHLHASLFSIINPTDNHCLSFFSAVAEHTRKAVASFFLARTEAGVSLPGKVSGTLYRVVEHHCIVCMDSFLNCIKTVRLGHDEENVKFKGCPGSFNVRPTYLYWEAFGSC